MIAPDDVDWFEGDIDIETVVMETGIISFSLVLDGNTT